MNEQSKGYYRYPTIHEDKIAFIADDDLWIVNRRGGVARRLTANLGAVSHPMFSSDGEWIAFTGREEGAPEIYVMPSSGGPATRVTYLGSMSMVVNWQQDRIIFATNYAQPFQRIFALYAVDPEGNAPEKLPFGPARTLSFGPQGLVLGRNTGDPARWKRYRGGTAGELWLDEQGTGEFQKLLNLPGNLADPMWIGDRIYFLSDHEGIGNIYSCQVHGRDVQQHTAHQDFYARNASTDGEQIVYHCGADLFVFDSLTGAHECINITYASPYIQRNRKFVSPQKYLETYALAADGSATAIVSRGKPFIFGNWEGPALQHGQRQGVRYRLARPMKDQQKLVMLSDEAGTYHLEVHTSGDTPSVQKFPELDIGIPYQLKVSPTRNEIALSNHRHELIWVNLDTQEMKTVERSEYKPIMGFNWAPDGNWIAYSTSLNLRTSIIKMYDVKTGGIHPVTKPVLHDVNPVFDPEGKYLYFLSYRIFNPVYDRLHFDLNFPEGAKPYAVTLRKDVQSPFVPQPRGFAEKKEKDKQKDTEKEQASKAKDSEKDEQTKDQEKPITIDFDGIQERIVPFPVAEGIYRHIAAIKNKVFYTTYPIEGARKRRWFNREPEAKACLKVFDLQELEEQTFLNGITSFGLSADGSAIICRIGNRLRVLKADAKPKDASPKDDTPSRKSGWLDLDRLKVSIDPIEEWKQMFREAWRLQREYFWVEDMSEVDWQKVFDRYYPLVERIASRSEFSDLIWEMQGELGTSHAYELGGHYRSRPHYKLGFLGADLTYIPQHDAYRIDHLVDGDVWDDEAPPPLKRPGVNVTEGMLLLAVGGERVSKTMSPHKLLVNQTDQEIQLTVTEADGTQARTVTVKPVENETMLRYREWVEHNRRYVHEHTNGKAGYIHIPNMGADGYAEFHRYFLVELDYDGVIVDVRFNGGGHVSQLLLEKLARKRIGYDLSRWMGAVPYPEDSVCGPLVALTNEHAGSDGDIFSHCFKLMKLGTLIGRRTWGGVIGIWPRNWLVDGTITTQPEFSFWFTDVGWGVENYGTDPDIEVDITPQEYAAGQDPQLDAAIAHILKEIEANPPLKPDFSRRPALRLPGDDPTD